jgi:acetyl-CoA carboxylase biotin carboxylase subunit
MQKVLVANRGEIAVRVIRACRDLGLLSVAVYSTADETGLPALLADESVCIGPPKAKDSYLNVEALLQAATQTGADAIHPGYGFLAESPAFAHACHAAGITFVGPSAEVIERMGDKAAARAVAREAGVPVVPGVDGIATVADAVAAAEEIGYPVMVKAAAGGGGRGIRVATRADELATLVEEAAREAEASFGDGRLYLERMLVGARHVEVQVLGDGRGNAIHVWERECSLQRRRQKVMEESPSPALTQETRAALCASAARLARSVSYAGAGTLEYLLDADGSFYFIEMNTRIQVEHPVTELVTGIDLVREQLRIAAGEPLSIRQEDVVQRGHAIEFRINAEDPARGFLPSPGTIEELRLPGGPGVRVDSAIYPGYAIPPFYDSLVAKLIVHGADRDEAISRGKRALRELHVEGIRTTTALHLELLDHPAVRAAAIDVEWLERHLAGG